MLTRLDTIASILKSRAAQGYANDLVLVYYWGKQTEYLGQNYFWTSETEPGAIAASSLMLGKLKERYFDRFAGAQVLLLDLHPDKQGSVLAHPLANRITALRPGCASESRTTFAILC